MKMIALVVTYVAYETIALGHAAAIYGTEL